VAELKVELERPRNRKDEAFLRLVDEVMMLLS
jgi:NitT/TauT family transport system ATP-binding protein